MVTKARPKQKPISKTPAAKAQKPALRDSLDRWCSSHRWPAIILIIVLSVALRITYFVQIQGTVLINQHKWEESDMFVFDQWADSIAAGDVLSQRYVQPEHSWMKAISRVFFRDHPDKLEYYKTLAGPDTVRNSPSKLLWTDWYGKKAFPHEPLYAYFIAASYKIFSKDVRWVFIWQLLAGVMTNLLIFLIARRHFGEFAGLLAAFLAVFFGPLMFFEMTLLRSSFAVLFTALLVWVTGTALIKKTLLSWILAGAVCGLASMVHAYFILFIFIWVGFLFLFYLKKWRAFGLAAFGSLIGLMAALSPVIVRNVSLELPALSLSNNSAIGVITMNNNTFKSFNGWMVEPQIVSDIMHATGGDLFKTVVPTLKTHKNIGSYLGQVWDKFHATFSWFEIPNNVNFYFCREYAPVLYLTFISFLFISPLALAGIGLALLKRKYPWPLFLVILVLMVPMLAFMVLARYRIVFAAVMVPFAAYAVAELFTSWKGWKNIVLLACIAAIAFLTSGPRDERTERITRLDYAVIYDVHYVRRLIPAVNEKNWKEIVNILNSFLAGNEPDAVRNAKPFYKCRTSKEAGIWYFFSTIHERRSQFLRLAGDTVSANKEAEFSARLKEAAQ